MNYQAIRASIENPLLTAFGALVPAVPVYFDNITAVPPNTNTEYVRVNITFGLTTDSTLTSSLDNARGAIIIRTQQRRHDWKPIQGIAYDRVRGRHQVGWEAGRGSVNVIFA